MSRVFSRMRCASFLVAGAVLLAGCSQTGSAAVVGTSAPTADSSSIPAGPDPTKYPGGRALLEGLNVPALPPIPSLDKVEQDFPQTTIDKVISDFTESQIKVGVYGDRQSKRTIALVGGSHAEMWITALDILGKRNGFKVKTYLKMGCPLSTDPKPLKTDFTPYPECYDWDLRVLDRLKHEKPYAVFTTSTRPAPSGMGDWLPPGYVDAFDQLMSAGITVYGLRDTPWPRSTSGDWETPTCLSQGGDADACGSVRDVVVAPVNPAVEFASSRPLFKSLDLTPALCTATECPAVVGNMIVYKDWHHLSATFVRSLTDELGRQMGLGTPVKAAKPN
ncbi:SGNH hydrolase domain-containing protein [Smaragdicoccus niigatensis]|uniref:SGNH hydrolase domain-containing protein n=1 Tax=Smaragdicoccus niigatensis TaxID=359359 RepID=UPI0012DCDF3D|nr:SGNH hydrolase domain-containing protein [Smaragdicoccus niigatensis]